MEGSLWSLYRRNYVKRFEFSTNEGFIYYMDASQGFQYGLNRSLIPITVRMLYERIEKNGAVSSLELRDLGIAQQDINWFYQKLCGARIIKSATHGKYLVFYNSEDKLNSYLKDYSQCLDELEARYVRKIKRQGQELENMVADFYKSLGFNIERNKFFTNSFGEHVEIDVLASRPEINLTIAVECKNYEASVLGPSILLKIARIKSVLPRAIVHIYAKHISNQFFRNKAFFHDEKYRDTFLFSTKQIHAMFEKLNIPKAS
jgi:Holliday junction resolvase-like predicted endonuclease